MRAFHETAERDSEPVEQEAEERPHAWSLPSGLRSHYEGRFPLQPKLSRPLPPRAGVVQCAKDPHKLAPPEALSKRSIKLADGTALYWSPYVGERGAWVFINSATDEWELASPAQIAGLPASDGKAASGEAKEPAADGKAGEAGRRPPKGRADAVAVTAGFKLGQAGAVVHRAASTAHSVLATVGAGELMAGNIGEHYATSEMTALFSQEDSDENLRKIAENETRYWREIEWQKNWNPGGLLLNAGGRYKILVMTRDQMHREAKRDEPRKPDGEPKAAS